MREKAKTQRRWPTHDILRRAQFVEDAGPIRFVDTEAAARYLALSAHTLECYRSRGGGPAYYKFGKWVRYAVDDLDAWAASCRRSTAASPEAPRVFPLDRT
ncbi:DNA-binding protein [Phyllobacterium phragmitis]|uniref:DNA-binding protein n=1 Tax=Phyllobacterium phragmitis TaxID=2670329 RepID=A0A2S9IKM5_9HYPH|nr:helix-turn-helix domain-containing protein [Phyllobacterium phragmitis]PRD41052.1 DNA-binding protein [Phyllobacterium phragmitis]